MSARPHTRGGLLPLALLAGVVLSAVALLYALPAATSGDRPAAGAVTPAGLGAAATAATPREPTISRTSNRQRSVTVRLRVGQTLSLARLAVVDPTMGTPRSPGKQDDWSLVSSPANTGRTARPPGAATFKPDVPGSYVFESKPGNGRGAAAARRTLTVQTEPVERLVCVNTRVQSAASTTPLTTVGKVEYAATSSTGIHVVVLERATIGQQDGTPANQTFDDLDQYKSFLSRLTDDDLVLVSGTVTSATKDAVWGPLGRLGAADLAVPDKGVGFSFIGIPGLGKGDGWQAAGGGDTKPVRSACHPGVAGDPTSNLSGWLTLDSTGTNYTYVAGDDVSVDTAPAAAPGTHAIQVGNRTYTIPLGQDHGWHAVVLERQSLCPEWAADDDCTPPDPLLNAGYGQDGSGFTAMANALRPYAGDPDALLILAPFAVSGWLPNVNPPPALVGYLRDFGGSVLAPGRAFEDPASRYALIGGGANLSGLPAGSAPPEIAESFTGFGDSGHIAGYLTRDHQNRFGPSDTGLGGKAGQGLHALAFGPTTPWPADTSSDAFKFLSGKLGYPVDADNQLGIRGKYDSKSSFSDQLTDLAQWKEWDALTPAQQQAAGGDEETYAAVYAEIHDEIQETDNVNDWVAKLKTIALGDGLKVKPLADGVVKQIDDTYPPPKEKSELALSLSKLLIKVASFIPEIGEVVEVAGEAIDVGLAIGRDVDGEPEDVRGQVFDSGTAMQDAALDFLAASEATLNHLAAIIVSDPHKLEIVGKNTGPVGDVKTASDQPWLITDDDENRLQTALTGALARWLMPAVVNAGFKVWQVQIPSDGGNILNGPDRTPVTYECNQGSDLFPDITHPFGGVPDPDGWIKLDNGTATYSLVLAGTRYSATDLENRSHHAPAPTQALLTTLFGTASNQLGFDKAWFFEQGFGETIGSKLFVDC